MLDKIKSNALPLFVGAVVVGGAYAMLSDILGSGPDPVADVTMPTQLSAAAQSGQQAFQANCAACHGSRAQGNNEGERRGPPLVHDIYNPGHHADQAFVLAVRRGVRQHHWPYGDMPPQPQVTDAQVGEIVAYVRELQQANGIRYKPHNM